jgi:Uma2 family endonuclease
MNEEDSMAAEVFQTTYRSDIEFVPTHHKMSAPQFQKLANAGAFEDAHVELFDGEIFNMSPVGAEHAALVRRLTEALREVFGKKYIIAVQDPIRLDDYTQPQPDLTVLHRRDDFYAAKLPEPADILLVIEVADTTRLYDRNTKMPRYARSSIPELWIIDVPTKQIEQYTQPREAGYRTVQYHSQGETLTCTSIENLTLAIDDIFGAK